MPSYNERENIPEAVERIVQILGDSLFEIIIVDDNSPDKTWELVEEMHVKDSRINVIRRIDKRGLASALADGTNAAEGDIIVWMDCDLGIPPEDIIKLTAKIPEYDIAIGSRYLKGGMDTRHWFRGWRMLQQDTPEDYILATGKMASVRDFLELCLRRCGYTFSRQGEGVNEKYVDVDTGKTIVEIDERYYRPAEVDLLCGDPSKAKEKLGWEAQTQMEGLANIMLESDFAKMGLTLPSTVSV